MWYMILAPACLCPKLYFSSSFTKKNDIFQNAADEIWRQPFCVPACNGLDDRYMMKRYCTGRFHHLPANYCCNPIIRWSVSVTTPTLYCLRHAKMDLQTLTNFEKVDTHPSRCVSDVIIANSEDPDLHCWGDLWSLFTLFVKDSRHSFPFRKGWLYKIVYCKQCWHWSGHQWENSDLGL